MKRRRINWWNVGIILMIIATLVLIALTPKFIAYAKEYRLGFGITDGIGGEYFVWIFPLFYLPVYFDRKSLCAKNK